MSIDILKLVSGKLDTDLFISRKDVRMSIDIRYVTNGTKAIYRIRDDSAGTFEVVEKLEDIHESIRHYAPKGEPLFVGPDMARTFGVIDILYPNFPKCGHPKYIGKNCIAEGCKYAEPSYIYCPWFNPSSKKENENE